MSASWFNDDNYDRFFWTIFGTLLVFGVALDILVGDGDVSRVHLIESIAISVLPAGIYWGLGRRGRAAVYAAIQRAGWARAEPSFQRLQEALKTRPPTMVECCHRGTSHGRDEFVGRLAVCSQVVRVECRDFRRSHTGCRVLLLRRTPHTLDTVRNRVCGRTHVIACGLLARMIDVPPF